MDVNDGWNIFDSRMWDNEEHENEYDDSNRLPCLNCHMIQQGYDMSYADNRCPQCGHDTRDLISGDVPNLLTNFTVPWMSQINLKIIWNNSCSKYFDNIDNINLIHTYKIKTKYNEPNYRNFSFLKTSCKCFTLKLLIINNLVHKIV